MAYFPNGTSGWVLDQQCHECPIGKHEDAPCPVLAVQLFYNYEQCKKGQEKLREVMSTLINEDGICQMKKVMDKYLPESGSDPKPSIHTIIPSMREWAKSRGVI